MITVRAGWFPGKLQTLQIEEGTTVGQLLKGLGITGGERRIGSDICSDERVLQDGEIVFVLAPVRGEADFKIGGEAWRVHKYDPDDIFPSDRHAHRYEAGEVICLHTGRIFDVRTRMHTRNMPKKHFRRLRAEITKHFGPEFLWKPER